ncbi:hypothetical protein AMJ80_12525 [bacterium SM23_31]|nr:MAG: hypothetical protein AMJ80_12525 [bacterium SM23_31]
MLQKTCSSLVVFALITCLISVFAFSTEKCEAKIECDDSWIPWGDTVADCNNNDWNPPEDPCWAIIVSIDDPEVVIEANCGSDYEKKTCWAQSK